MNIGLIAGNGRFPLLFADAAGANGYRVFAAAYKNNTLPEIEDRVCRVKWLHLGEIERLIAFFSENNVDQTVIIGGINKTSMFTDIKPDNKALELLSNLPDTHDDAVLRGFADILEKEGIAVRASTFLLPELLTEEGCWTSQQPDEKQENDIAIGWRTAKAMGKLDVGQCVVVEKGSVLAVEAIEGTDAAIKRGGSLGGGNAVVVKVCKPHQDLRFDIPAVGAQTISRMQQSGARVLAIEAGKALVFDRRQMIELAEKYNICIVARRDAS